MKISKRDIGIIITVIGVVVLLYVYNFVFVSFRDKKEATEAEIASLSKTEANLQQLADNRAEYEKQIVELTEKNNQIIDHFPANILPENEIMYGVELEQNAKIFFNSLEYGVATLFCEDAAPQTTETTTDELTGETTTTTTTAAAASTTGIQANLLTMNMGFEATYQGLKDAILYTKDQNDRMVMDGVTAAFDPTTGMLSGNMTLNQYYITGTDKSYVEPYVPATRTGTDNIFGSYEK